MEIATNRYIDEATNVLDRFKKIKSEDGWKHVVTKEGTELYRKSFPEVSSVPGYMVTTTINKPKNDVVDKVWAVNEDLAKQNDPKLTMWKEVEKAISWKVCSQYNSMAWPIWPRHTVFAQTRFDDANKTYLVAHSVEHPSVPLQDSTHVRTKIHMSVYEYIDNGDNTTKVTRITQIDPCGNIPVALINLYAGNLVDVFNKWKKD